MKVVVTGHKGLIGSKLVERGYEPLDCDITNLEETTERIHSVNPDVIIHCAALTNVGYCEQKKNREEAFAVNVGGTNNLLYDFSGILIYLSTVHVFNGRKYWDYRENHRPDPLNTYGFTKWAGEEISRYGTARSVVVRLSKVFDKYFYWGFEELSKLKKGEEIICPTFMKRSFQYLPHFVENLIWLVERLEEFPDLEILNIAGEHTLSYYQFWQQLARAFGIDENLVKPRKHEIEDYPRPFRGGLSVSKAKGMGMPLYSAWDGLQEIANE